MSSTLGPFAAFLSSCTWALGVSLYSKLSLDHSAPSISMSRATVAFPLFVIGGLIVGDFQALDSFPTTAAGWMLLSMLSSFVIADMLFLWSTRSLGVSGGLAIGSIYPLWATLGGWLYRNEVLTSRQQLGILLTTLGVVGVILASPRKLPPMTKSIWWLDRKPVGVWLALTTSFLWAVNSFAAAQGTATVTPLVGNSIRMFFALLLCPIVGAVLQPNAPRLLPAPVFKKYWPVMAVEAFVGSICFLYGFKHTPVGVASALSALAPVISAPITWMFGYEKFSLLKFLAVATAGAGTVLLVL